MMVVNDKGRELIAAAVALITLLRGIIAATRNDG